MEKLVQNDKGRSHRRSISRPTRTRWPG